MKQQNKTLFSQLGSFGTNFLIGQSNLETQIESRANVVERDTVVNGINYPIQVNGSRVGMHTLEKNIVSKVRVGVGSKIVTAETRIQDPVMTAM